MRQGSWGLRETGRQQRRRRIAFLMRILIYVLVVCGVAWFSYSEGRRISQSRIDNLESQVIADAHRQRTKPSPPPSRPRVPNRNCAPLSTPAKTRLRDEAAAWQQRYESEVPHGEAAVLWTQVTERLGGRHQRRAAGRDHRPRRRRTQLRRRNADQTHRRQDRVPRRHGECRKLRRRPYLGDRQRARRRPTKTAIPAAWFDPAKPVSLVFSTIGGGTETIEGPLPVYHNVLIGSDQYRFAVSEGPPDFAIVTVERCDYP